MVDLLKNTIMKIKTFTILIYNILIKNIVLKLITKTNLYVKNYYRGIYVNLSDIPFSFHFYPIFTHIFEVFSGVGMVLGSSDLLGTWGFQRSFRLNSWRSIKGFC